MDTIASLAAAPEVAPATVDATAEVAFPPRGQAWFACVVLTLGCVLAFMDRGVLSLLLVPIQRDLGVSDTQMGLLIGFAFGVFNALFGLPIGRWVDVGNRKTIAAAGVLVWSAANAACGLAGSFWQLFLARTAIGAGEGAVSPASVSLIADYFPPGRRGAAMGLFYSGMNLGGGGVLLAGGAIWLALGDRLINLPVLGPLHSWQIILIGFGALGLVVAPLTLAIREPPRVASVRAPAGEGGTLQQTAAFFSANARALLGLVLGLLLNNFTVLAGGAWLPAILMRSHGWTLAQTGYTYGLILILVAPLGAFSSGLLGDHLLKRGVADGRIRVGIAAVIGIGISGVLVGLLQGPLAVTAALVAFTFCVSFALPIGPSALQEAVPNQMRGQAIALYVCSINIVANGSAAVIVGFLTQHYFGAARTGSAFALLAALAGGCSALTLAYCRGAYGRLVAAQLGPMRVVRA